MISLLEYISYGEVRAALGVSSYELPDDTLALPMYARALQAKLDSITGTVGDRTGTLRFIFEGISLDSSPTDAEEAFSDQVSLFAVYVVAEVCLSGLSLLALKSESDGKAVQTRFSDASTFMEVGKAIRAKLSEILDVLIPMTGGVQATQSLLSAVKPLTDPVTG